VGNIDKRPEEVRRGLKQAVPGLRRTILKRLPLAVAAMIDARTQSAAEPAMALP
jgi:hypothetical protein